MCARSPRGSGDILKLLHDKFGLDAADARANGNYALRAAASLGHMAVVQCLFETFGLQPSDATTEYNTTEDRFSGSALSLCVKYHQLQILQYLCETCHKD